MPFHRNYTPAESSALALLFLFQLWLAHALGYLVHEYAHSFTAWAFRAKANPLAIDYGHLTWSNILLLSGMDENVDYKSIFDAGRGPLVALIAVAGVLFGNGICYLLARWLFSQSKALERPLLACFFFLFLTMNVGNFLAYVPNRTFTTHADMANIERGLNISPWWIVIVLGIPFALAIWHFFQMILPDARRFLFPASKPGQIFLVLLTCGVVFAFFGSAGFNGYGELSHWIASASLYVLLPLSILLCWPRRTLLAPG